SNNTIRGASTFWFASDGSSPLTNDGLIEATGSFGITFQPGNVAANVVNNGTFRANGGPLILNGSANTTYLNNGLIEAMPGNTVFINSPVIGGTLSSLGLIQLTATTKVSQLQSAA